LEFAEDRAIESRASNPESRLGDDIRERGPLTVAAFMEFALYDQTFGYYARAAQRSGRAGDFFTSVDVGALFGELLAAQLAEMFHILHASDCDLQPSDFDLVEAGAGNGRLSADILRALRDRHPALYPHVRLHLIEASAAAREAQRETLGDVRDRLSSASGLLPDSFEGVLVANELLDAFPVHQVVMREDGLKETYVAAARRTIEGPPSTPELEGYLDRLGVRLEPGWRVEINLRAVDWIRDAAQRLTRGFIILIDYGNEARELYSASHAHGTLTTFSGHRTDIAQGAAPWLEHPGEQDITAHVDFTSVRDAAEAAGLTTIAFLDQTYFVLGLVSAWNGAALAERARALKTLLVPGGLGSTHKVMIFGKGVGTPALLGCSFGVRVT
jgi:SAM-dependent MidA family methyltransferase